MNRQPTLTGPNLLLRPLTEADWDALFAVASDPLIWEVHPAHDRWQEDVFRAFFADALAQSGALVVIDRKTGAIIGSSRYQGHDPVVREVEIGWTFVSRAYWGGATNREMKRLMLEHAFRFVDNVLFHVGEGNLRSRGAMTKIGGILTDRVEERIMAGTAVRHVIFTISKADFEASPLARGEA